MKRVIIILISTFISLAYAQDEIANANVSVVTFDYKPIPGAQIHFRDTLNNKIYSGVSDKDGKFKIDLPAGIYWIQLKSVGEAKDYSAIEIPKLEGREMYGNVDIIIRYEEETTFTLSNLHFETNKSVIKPSSYNELDELVRYLELKPDIKIEVAGHTDSDGSESSNMTLSQNRAKAVKDYLISKGITADRIIAKGYGESKPIADNGSEAGKALNRRTEIHIIK